MTQPTSETHRVPTSRQQGDARPAIRLICLDVDGTLLDSRLQLREGVKAALQRASGAGIAVAIFTGRNLDSTLPIARALGLELTIVSCSGAHLQMTNGQGTEICMSPEQARDVVQIALDAGSGMFIDRPERSWAIGNREFVERYSDVNNGTFTTDLAQALAVPPLKISIINERDKLEHIRSLISVRSLDLQMASPFETVVDVTPAEATKGHALRTLSAIMGIGLGQVAAIGDSENDLSMFEISGLSVAMGNAGASVREAADWVAPSNDEEGVAWVVDRIMAGGLEPKPQAFAPDSTSNS